MFKIIKNNIFLTLLLIVGVFLAVKNYTPGTFLSGWDTLHPEFNFGLAFQRQINGVFRPEQGLGAVAAHSHMADLPRTIILYIFHFILPSSALRYSYIFLNLILGPIGMYFFLKKYIAKNKIASFLGSLFYLLNLGTMQQFVVPFEMFTTQFALLPWLFLTAADYLYSEEKTNNRLLFFALTTLFAAPMAYAATLWYIYFLVFVLFLISLSIFSRSSVIFKRSLMLAIITLAVNSFWILPNLYFVLNHGKNVADALINQLFSSQAFLYNKEFGNLRDIALLKNFLFDWTAYAGNGNFALLLLPWIRHLNQPLIQLIGFLFAVLAIFGMVFALFKKNKLLLSFVPALLICLFFLINDNLPTSFLYNFLAAKIPLFKEAFRFPDDKVLGLFTFIFTIYLSFGLQAIINKLSKSFKVSLLLIYLLLITTYIFPAFQGNLVSPYMRIKIPDDYFKMFAWFDKQNINARVAEIPIHSLWGWKYYKWPAPPQGGGFQGADFLQFGIQQPLLDRDFDRWNPANEQYYREMSQAIYSQDQKKLNNVLEKFNISYILLDKNVIAPEQGMNSQVLFFKETENLLKENSGIELIFNSGNLSVYNVNNVNPATRIITNPISAGPQSQSFYDDFIYSKYSDYVSYSDIKQNAIVYPFRNIIDNKSRLLLDSGFPALSSGNLQYNVVPAENPQNECPSNSKENNSKMEIIQQNREKFLRYVSDTGSLCNHYSFPTLPRNQGYLITVTSKNVSGLPLKICVANYLSKRCDLTTQLSAFATPQKDVFLLPPIGNEVGFDVNLNNLAIKNTTSVNDLYSVTATPFPYQETLQTENFQPENEFENKSFLVHSQSFDPGWKAYQTNFQFSIFNFQLADIFPFLFGKELKEHVLVNNWANGWVLAESLIINHSSFVIIYWPQYLEYLGLLILGGTLTTILAILFKKKAIID